VEKAAPDPSLKRNARSMSTNNQYPIEGGCHCRWCQRESGAFFALNAMIEAGQVSDLGVAPEIVDTPTDSCLGQKVARRTHLHGVKASLGRAAARHAGLGGVLRPENGSGHRQALSADNASCISSRPFSDGHEPAIRRVA